MECNPLQEEARRANLDCPRPASASRQPVGGVGSLATPGTTQAVLAVQVVGPLHTTANGSGLDHFQRNFPEGVSAHIKKGAKVARGGRGPRGPSGTWARPFSHRQTRFFS